MLRFVASGRLKLNFDCNTKSYCEKSSHRYVIGLVVVNVMKICCKVQEITHHSRMSCSRSFASATVPKQIIVRPMFSVAYTSVCVSVCAVISCKEDVYQKSFCLAHTRYCSGNDYFLVKILFKMADSVIFVFEMVVMASELEKCSN